jgi:hypothetical protein
MVNIYFGKADPEHESIEELFEHNGNYYYFKLEMHDEQFVLRDTCNRYVPFEYEAAVELGKAVHYVYEHQYLHNTAEKWIQRGLQNLTKMYGLAAR